MPSASPFNALLSFLKVTLALLLAGYYGYYAYDQPYVGACLLTILLAGSLSFVLLSSAVGLVGMWMFSHVVTAGISVSVTESFLIVEVLLAALFLYRKRLASSALRALGLKSHWTIWLTRYSVTLWVLAAALIALPLGEDTSVEILRALGWIWAAVTLWLLFAPGSYRRFARGVLDFFESSMDEAIVRIFGLVAVAIGVALIYFGVYVL